MSLEYRDGTPADAAAIAELFRQSFVATFGHLYPAQDLATFLGTMTVNRFAQELADDRFVFHLATQSEEPVGYIKLGPPDLPVATPPRTIELCQLYVLAAWQGTGVARTLMDWALASASSRGAQHIQLSVYVENHRARRFYERYGFVPVDRYDFMVGNHADDDIVLRHLVMEASS